jgi:hypothetical protein
MMKYIIDDIEQIQDDLYQTSCWVKHAGLDRAIAALSSLTPVPELPVKTWKERLGNSPHIVACGAVGEAMQDEITELRALCQVQATNIEQERNFKLQERADLQRSWQMLNKTLEETRALCQDHAVEILELKK